MVKEYAYVNTDLIGEPYGSAIGVEVYYQSGDREYFFFDTEEEAELKAKEVNILIDLFKPDEPFYMALDILENTARYSVLPIKDNELFVKEERVKEVAFHSLQANMNKPTLAFWDTVPEDVPKTKYDISLENAVKFLFAQGMSVVYVKKDRV